LTGSKKNLQCLTTDEKRALIEGTNKHISISRQCELLGLSRGAYYYQPRPVSEKNLLLMRLIDEEYTRHPFYGSRRLRGWLKDQDLSASRDKVRRIMKLMGLEAIYPKKRLSLKNKEHKTYPYLLRDLKIDHPDHVWASDITYIRLRRGFAYLVAVMDWFSRFVLAWELSLSLDSGFCINTLKKALSRSRPEIFNSDQGSQYTSCDLVQVLDDEDIRISMDGQGRAFDNIMVERLWRTVKYEDVYLKDYRDYQNACYNLEAYFHFYNQERKHSSLGNKTPIQIYGKNNKIEGHGRGRSAGGFNYATGYAFRSVEAEVMDGKSTLN
jgi:putative transposase